MEKICGMIENPEAREHMRQVYLEYTSHESAEAKYVKSLDLLDMFVQAYEYERLHAQDGIRLDLSEFLTQCRSGKHEFEPSVRACIDELIELRSSSSSHPLPADSNLNTILKFHVVKKQ